MKFDYENINSLVGKYGSPFYVFYEQEFVENYYNLQNHFRNIYEKYNISYSYKTNYTPYIANIVKKNGGYAEVVSSMEYYIAKRLGYEDSKIIFNGPNKGDAGKGAFLNGCIINADSLDELNQYCDIASRNENLNFEVGIRVNMDVGQDFISRFGIDIDEIGLAFEKVKLFGNLKIVGIHCHISRCRGLDAWKKRAEIMLDLADKFFDNPPKYIDLGSGMFGYMEESLAKQFDNIPTYKEYAEVVAGIFASHYKDVPLKEKPWLFTEPGTTLINKYVDFIGKVETIKKIRGKYFAVLNCSIHNLGETCLLKEIPLEIVSCGEVSQKYEDIDFTGYTCLEQDVMRKNYTGTLNVGDYVKFGNVGGYSNVLKPPFIWPNCAMVAINTEGKDVLIKAAETFEDILHTYAFEKE